MTRVCPFSAPFSKTKNAVTPVNAEITAFIDSIVAFCPSTGRGRSAAPRCIIYAAWWPGPRSKFQIPGRRSKCTWTRLASPGRAAPSAGTIRGRWPDRSAVPRTVGWRPKPRSACRCANP